MIVFERSRNAPSLSGTGVLLLARDSAAPKAKRNGPPLTRGLGDGTCIDT